MKGQKSYVSTLPDNLGLDNGATSLEPGVNLEMSWNSMQSSVQNLLPEYRITSNGSNLHHARHEGQSGEWSLGQTSSSSSQHLIDQNEGKTGHTWSICPRAATTLEEHQYEPSRIFSSDTANVTSDGDHTTNGLFILHNSRADVLPQDFNTSSGYRNHEDDGTQVLDYPNFSISMGTSNDLTRYTGDSPDSFELPSVFGGYVAGDSDNCTGSLDSRRSSCKRKASEVVGQSSGAGSSNFYQNAERSQLDTVPAAQIAATNSRMTVQIDINLDTSNEPELLNSRLRIGIGETVSATPLSLTASESAESSRGNLLARINGSHWQDPIPVNPSSTEANFGNADISSSQNLPGFILCHDPLDLNPAPATENGSVHGQSALLHVPFIRRNLQSRWDGSSSSRASRSSPSNISFEEDAAFYEEATQRNIPRSISDHPIFIPAIERRSSSQHPINWHFANGNNVAGNVASTSRTGSSSGINSPAPTWAHRSCPEYPRRLSEIVRRSLLSSVGTESGVQNSSLTAQSSSSTTSQEPAFTFGSGNHLLIPRSTLLERHPNGAFGVPYPPRTLASASEGRSAIMSEQIRRVLDLMRRGEGLRFEDVMILDNSFFFGMADIHDRHRDMRLDVDNMSYEELLALEERIGNVCTGLTEQTISNLLKKKKYVQSIAKNPKETTEPCSICREEYMEGDDLGTLDCGHDFHRNCIKQWLVHKNLCPICKTTGLTM